MTPRKSPKNTQAKALEAALSIYENDKRLAEFLDAKKEEGWAKNYLAITTDPELGELVTKLFIHEPSSRCLLWTGSVDAGGYPRLRFLGHLRPVQRVAWQLFNHMPLHPNIIIRMTCNDKRCTSLGHMRLESKAGPLFQAGYGKGPRAKDGEGGEGRDGS